PAARHLVWALPPVYLAGVLAYVVLDRRLGSPGLDPAEGLPLFLGFGVSAVAGALLVSRRPRNAVGWLMAAAALLLVLGAAGDTYAAWVMTTSGRPDVLAVLGAWLQSWYWFVLLGCSWSTCRCCSPTAGCRLRGGAPLPCSPELPWPSPRCSAC
ncbi:MAG: hypothetical protein M3Q47_15695, partial [Actinomycetota bacterium]|nr:hypothetical protein [Actinomycetota bacterium]